MATTYDNNGNYIDNGALGSGGSTLYSFLPYQPPSSNANTDTTTPPPPVVNGNQANNTMNNIQNHIGSAPTQEDNSSATYDPLVQFKSQLEGLDETLQSSYATYLKQINDIQTGSFPLSPNEKMLLTALQGSFATQARAQSEANKNYEAGLKVQGIRSGVSAFSPHVAAQGLNQAVQEGLQKINDINVQANLKIAETRQGFADNRFKAAKEAYDQYTQLMDDRRAEIEKLYTATSQHDTDLRNYNLEVQKFNEQKNVDAWQIEKIKNDIANSGASALLSESDIKDDGLGGKYVDLSGLTGKDLAKAKSMLPSGVKVLDDKKSQEAYEGSITALSRLEQLEKQFKPLGQTTTGEILNLVHRPLQELFNTSKNVDINAYNNTSRLDLFSLIRNLSGMSPRLNTIEYNQALSAIPTAGFGGTRSKEAEKGFDAVRQKLLDGMNALLGTNTTLEEYKAHLSDPIGLGVGSSAETNPAGLDL